MKAEHSVKDRILPAHLPKDRIRVSEAKAFHEDQLLRLSDGQRLQQQRVEQAEDRRIRADANRQRKRGHGSEAFALKQHSEAKTKVLKERIDKSDSTHIAMSLLQQSDVSELAARGPSRLCLTHSLAEISLGEQAQVSLDLVVELSIRSAISEQSPKSGRQFTQIMDHLYSWPSSFNSRPIAPAIRSQFPVSCASCFGPLFVIE